jgi:hypothetical protein
VPRAVVHGGMCDSRGIGNEAEVIKVFESAPIAPSASATGVRVRHGRGVTAARIASSQWQARHLTGAGRRA